MEVQSLSEVSMSNLPAEIIEDILKRLDGASIINCKRTCLTLRNQVNYLEKNLVNFWFKHCQNEMPHWAQFDILDNVYPSHWKNKACVDWQIIYKCWNFWKQNHDSDTHCELLSPNLTLCGIKSIKHSGCWLLISTYHGQGKLIAWNLETSSFFTVYEVIGGMINFELVNTDGQVPPNSKRKMTIECSGQINELFNTLEHDEIWIEVEMCYIRLGRDYVHKIDRVQQKIRHSYGYEARLINDRFTSVLYLNKICQNVEGPEAKEVNLPLKYEDIYQFRMNKVTLLKVECSRIKTDTVTFNHKSQDLVFDSAEFPNHDQTKFYSWQNTLFVSFSGTRLVAIRHDDVSIEQATPLKKGVITAALFYAGNLFLGNDRGQLMMYQVSEPADCLAVKVYESDCWTVHVNPNKLVKIISISVVESKHPGVKPVIICASSEEVYRISFPGEKVKPKRSKCAIKEVRW